MSLDYASNEIKVVNSNALIPDRAWTASEEALNSELCVYIGILNPTQDTALEIIAYNHETNELTEITTDIPYKVRRTRICYLVLVE